MIAVLTAPDNIRNPTITTKAWNSSLIDSGPTKFIARPEIKLVKYWGRMSSGMIATAKKETSEVNKDDYPGLFQVLELRVFELAVHLCKRLFAAHGKHRVTKRDHYSEQSDK